MKRKIKLYTRELLDYLHSINNDPYGVVSKSIPDMDGRYIRGNIYKLSRSLTYEEKMYLDSFANIMLMQARSQYAPEQVKDCVWLGDICLKSKKGAM